jgi:biopolymer transport protein TolR
MAAALEPHDEAISAINVTPFVDVVLVLLVILMVTSTELVRRSIQVDLPTAAAGGQAVPRTLNVVLAADGTLALDGAPVTEAELSIAVAQARATDPEVRAVLSADQRVAYQQVVALIDRVKAGGVHKFALDVAPRGAP